MRIVTSTCTSEREELEHAAGAVSVEHNLWGENHQVSVDARVIAVGKTDDAVRATIRAITANSLTDLLGNCGIPE